MNATVVAMNHALGAIVVERDDKTCVVLETSDRFVMDIGDVLNGDWLSSDYILVQNENQENPFTAKVQKITQSRSEAISAISLI